MARAEQMPSKENTVKTKQLNIWTSGDVKWLDVSRFEECGRSRLRYPDAFESMSGRDCYTGLDLSAKVDFTAASHLFPPTEEGEPWTILLRLWVPEATAKLRERRDRIPLAKWVDADYVTLTDGEVVDYDKVEADLIADGETFNIREIGFDPWNATATATHLDLEGFSMVQMRQGFATMAAPYQIPYGTLLPPKCQNLLVPVAASSSHVGFCALRLEPIWTAMGEASGVAAHLAIRGKGTVQAVSPVEIRGNLQRRGAGTIYTSDVLPGHPDFLAVQWWGSLGGLHGLHAAFEQPGHRGAHLQGQYFKAFPGHAVDLNKELDASLRIAWTALAREAGVERDLKSASSRGRFIRAAFRGRAKTRQ